MSEKEYYGLLIRWTSKVATDLHWFADNAPEGFRPVKVLYGLIKTIERLRGGAEIYQVKFLDAPVLVEKEHDDE